MQPRRLDRRQGRPARWAAATCARSDAGPPGLLLTRGVPRFPSDDVHAVRAPWRASDARAREAETAASCVCPSHDPIERFHAAAGPRGCAAQDPGVRAGASAAPSRRGAPGNEAAARPPATCVCPPCRRLAAASAPRRPASGSGTIEMDEVDVARSPRRIARLAGTRGTRCGRATRSRSSTAARCWPSSKKGPQSARAAQWRDVAGPRARRSRRARARGGRGPAWVGGAQSACAAPERRLLRRTERAISARRGAPATGRCRLTCSRPEAASRCGRREGPDGRAQFAAARRAGAGALAPVRAWCCCEPEPGEIAPRDPVVTLGNPDAQTRVISRRRLRGKLRRRGDVHRESARFRGAWSRSRAGPVAARAAHRGGGANPVRRRSPWRPRTACSRPGWSSTAHLPREHEREPGPAGGDRAARGAAGPLRPRA
jgi:hypothetical protein